MPIIIVEAIEGRTLDQKRGLVKAITDAVCEHYRVGPDHVHIVLRDVPRENIASSGTLACDNK